MFSSYNYYGHRYRRNNFRRNFFRRNNFRRNNFRRNNLYKKKNYYYTNQESIQSEYTNINREPKKKSKLAKLLDDIAKEKKIKEEEKLKKKSKLAIPFDEIKEKI